MENKTKVSLNSHLGAQFSKDNLRNIALAGNMEKVTNSLSL